MPVPSHSVCVPIHVPRSGSELGQDDKTVERIFTDAQIQVVIRKVRCVCSQLLGYV